MAANPHTDRKPATPALWRRDAAPLRHVGEEEFRAFSKRRGKDHVLLGGTATLGPARDRVIHWNGMVEEVTWDDVTAILGGSITLRRPPYEPDTPDVMDGDEIRLEYREHQGSNWQEMWTMRAYNPQYDFDAGTIQYQLMNDLGLLDASEDDFVYQKSKKHPHGWLVHEVMADVCRRYGVKAKLVATKHRILKHGVTRNVSPWQFLKKLKNMEETKTGRKLLWRYENHELRLVPIQRSQAMLILGPTLIAAALQKTREDRFATAVTVRQAGWTEGDPQSGKGHRKTKPKKLFVNVRSSAAIRRYGYVHRIVYSPDATSRGELMREGKRWIANVIKSTREFTITHPGIPTLKRGHAILIALPDENLRVLVFVSELHFQVGGGEFYMDVTFTTDDPYTDDQQQKIIDKLADSPRNTKSKGSTKKHKKPKANANRTPPTKAAPAPKKPKTTDGQRLKRKYGGP